MGNTATIRLGPTATYFTTPAWAVVTLLEPSVCNTTFYSTPTAEFLCSVTYTLDSSLPTANSSAAYTSPLSLPSPGAFNVTAALWLPNGTLLGSYLSYEYVVRGAGGLRSLVFPEYAVIPSPFWISQAIRASFSLSPSVRIALMRHHSVKTFCMT